MGTHRGGDRGGDTGVIEVVTHRGDRGGDT